MGLPTFKYHPDPIGTGSIKPGDDRCDCCGQQTGYVYCASFYSTEEVTLCPWCIADGSAAKKFEGQFSDDHPLREAGLSDDIVTEVCERTPGYNSWQQENWQSHCGDACEFHGDARRSELALLIGPELEAFLTREMVKSDSWSALLANYEEGGNPGIYKFICRHCSTPVYTMDFT